MVIRDGQVGSHSVLKPPVFVTCPSNILIEAFPVIYNFKPCEGSFSALLVDTQYSTGHSSPTLQCPLNSAQYISRPIHQPASEWPPRHVTRVITHPGHAAPRLHGPPPPLEQVVALVRYIRGALAAAAELASVCK